MFVYVYILLLAAAIFQVVGFLLRLFFTKSKRTNPYRERLKIYGSLVLVYFILLLVAFILEMNHIVSWNTVFIVIYIFIIPAMLAIYYWNAVYRKYDEKTNQ